jgi:glycosyltransferase involved in cell wall biosynthesis
MRIAMPSRSDSQNSATLSDKKQSPDSAKAKVSVFIQTLDEESNLPRCLESLTWSDDIVVLDSISSDRTEEIVRGFKGRFYQRPYDGRANNQNWAVENIDFKYSWVWYVDADEVTPPELAREIQETCSDPSRPEVAYYVRRRNYFMGRWLKHGGMYDVWIARLWRPDKIRWQRDANPIALIDGPTGRLQNDFHHYFFSKGISDWFVRHNKYSSCEAEETIKSRDGGDFNMHELFSRDPVTRRNALKRLSFRMPARPFAKFTYMYLLRAGFLDGRAGLTYAVLMSIYEYMICCKVNEIKRREKGLPV